MKYTITDNIAIAKDATVHPSAIIIGPAIIGHKQKSELMHL